MKAFYTAIIRASGVHWVALCLENGVVGQGSTKEDALDKLKEAIASFEEVVDQEGDVCSGPLSIAELHEFLTLGSGSIPSEAYELRAVNA